MASELVEEPFLTLRDRVACLVNATILLPVSVFIVGITIRNVDNVSGIIDLYVLGVKCSSALVSMVTAILCCFIALTSPRRSYSLAGLLFGILAAFGALFALATIFFNSEWAGHWEALQRMVFVLVAILNLICTVVITILLARRFQNPVFETVSRGNDPDGCLPRSSTILAALVVISGATGLAGFSLGVVVNWRLIRESEILGGGSHSGFLACLTGVLFLSALYGCKRYPETTLSSALILAILCLVGAAISFYTEELEFKAEIAFIESHKLIFSEAPEYEYGLLAKSSLVIFSSVFTLVFGTPLAACICCLLRSDVLKVTPTSPPLQGQGSLWLPPRQHNESGSRHSGLELTGQQSTMNSRGLMECNGQNMTSTTSSSDVRFQPVTYVFSGSSEGGLECNGMTTLTHDNIIVDAGYQTDLICGTREDHAESISKYSKQYHK